MNLPKTWLLQKLHRAQEKLRSQGKDIAELMEVLACYVLVELELVQDNQLHSSLEKMEVLVGGARNKIRSIAIVI